MPNEWETYTEGGRKRLRRRPVRYHAATSTAAAAPAVVAEAVEPVAAAAATDYATHTKADLVTIATDRGLDATGTKADIVARLEDDDDGAA